MKKRTTFFLLAFCLIAVFFVGQAVMAQTVTEGTVAISEEVELTDTDPRRLAVRIIQIFLGLLSLILLGLILWGGYQWMTAAGNEDKIESAKRTLINAGIGFVIIVSAWSITFFLMRRFESAGVIGGGAGPGGVFGPGGGLGQEAFLVRGITPREGDVSIRNAVVRIELNQAIDPETFTAEDIEFRDITGGADIAVPVEVLVSEQNDSRIEIRSQAECDAPHADRRCFAGNRQFRIKVLEGTFASRGGIRLSCANNQCTRHFSTNNLIDVRGPEVRIVNPQNGAVVPQGLVPITVNAIDDSGIAAVDVRVGDALVGTALVPPYQVLWDASGVPLGSRHAIRAEAFDLDENRAMSEAVTVEIRAAACFNGVKDADETAIDCGGGNCGACPGAVCQNDNQCANGACRDGQCVAWPIIRSFSPREGGMGTFVTIQGNFFGAQSGRVTFLGDPDAPADDVSVNGPPAGCDAGTWWQDHEIIIAVPPRAATGPLRVDTRAGFFDTTDNERGIQSVFQITNVVPPGLCSVRSFASGEARGIVGEEIVAIGSNFGNNAAGNDELTIGGRKAPTDQWQDARIRGRIPSVRAGLHAAQVTVRNLVSNPVNFGVEAGVGEEAPEIISLDPNPVAPGGYLTIRGRNFGETIGRVLFITTEGREFLSDPVAAVCGENWWKSTVIVVRVPLALANVDDENLLGANIDMQVIVERSDQQRSAASLVEVGGALRPGVCAIVPDNGPAGLVTVRLVGQGFGAVPGRVRFTPNATVQGVAGSWTDEEATVRVPLGAETGEVRLIDSDNSVSNSVLFTVAACNPQDVRSCGEGLSCCADQSCRPFGECQAAPPLRVYRWSFTTRAGRGIDSPCDVDNQCGEGLMCQGNQCVPDPSEDPTFCRANSDCQNICGASQCVQNHCTPVVEDMSPARGMPGTWVTIQGCFLGERTGTVTFLGNPGRVDDDRPALVPDKAICGDTWTNEFIVVEVPNVRTAERDDDAVTGPLEIETANARRGQQFVVRTPPFAVDGTLQPGICRIDPPVAKEGDQVRILGQNFGDVRPEESRAAFQEIEAARIVPDEVPEAGGARVVNWGNNEIRVTVPAGTPERNLEHIKRDVVGGAAVGVQVKLLQGLASARESNKFPLYLPPFINLLEPNHGSPGSWVTIRGGNFGYRRFGQSLVTFSGVPESGLPAWCTSDKTWTPTQIITAAPQIPFPSGPVFVRTGGGFATAPEDTKPFAVTNEPLGPGLCALEPAAGPRQIPIVARGDRLGGQGPDDRLVFANEQEAVIRGWQNTEIQSTVPVASETGLVIVRKKVDVVRGRQCVGGVVIGNQCVGGAFQEVRESVSLTSNPLFYTIERAGPGEPCAGDNDCQFGACEEAAGVCEQPDADDFVRARVVNPPAQNACPNTAVIIEFSSNVNRATITNDTILLFKDNGVDPCPAGVASDIDQEAGNPEPERIWCHVETDAPEVVEIEGADGQARVVATLPLRAMLDTEHRHRVRVKAADENGIGGVLTEQGLSFENGRDLVYHFQTRRDVCIASRVSFQPPQLSFESRSDAKGARALMLDQEGNTLSPIPGHSWSWAWQNPNEALVRILRAQSASVLVEPTGENGRGQLDATARIEEDRFNRPPIIGKTITGNLPISVFICENPWSDGSLYDRELNFEMMYCRDHVEGGEEGVPLPDFTTESVRRPPAGILREWLLKHPERDDVIGVRVIRNSRNVNPREWYAAQAFEGNPSELSVDGFPALQVGTTVYVHFPVIQTQGRVRRVSSYVLVFSHNAGAGDDTTEVFRRLRSSLIFALNQRDYIDPLRQDIRRVAALVGMYDTFAPRAAEGTIPLLQAGSYLRGISTSAWPSWAQTLGRAVGVSLPVDPVNTFASCGVDQGYNQQTCWNEEIKRFSCQPGSHVYGFMARGVDDFIAMASLAYADRPTIWEGEQSVGTARIDYCAQTAPPSTCSCFNAFLRFE